MPAIQAAIVSIVTCALHADKTDIENAHLYGKLSYNVQVIYKSDTLSQIFIFDLTQTLAGRLCEDHRSEKRFCGKLYN